MNRRCPLLMRFTSIAFLVECVAIFQTSSATPPDPPTQLCVNNVCTKERTANGVIKWHPGHYALSDTRPAYPNARSEYNSEIAQMTTIGQFKGWMGEYSWYWLEPSPGVYNWSLIDADLAALPAGYKLIIMLTIEDTGAHAIPNVPQPVPYSAGSLGNTNGMLPDAIITGISGQGSDAIVTAYYGSYTAAWWRTPVWTRYCALIAAAGARYDGNPNVEMIIPIQETSQALATIPGDFTAAAAVTGWNAIVDATAAAWPTTVKILDNNWPATSMAVSDLLATSQHAVSKGFGVGGPDILYPPQQTETNGSQILTGAYGGTDYRGTIASAYQEQADWSNWTNETPAPIEAYCYGTLACTHVIWGVHGSYAGAQYQWSAVTAALQAVNFRIHSACPTSYSGGCITN